MVWGRVNKSKKQEIIDYYQFQDVLSLEDMINDLLTWNDMNYQKYIEARLKWVKECMIVLLGHPSNKTD